MNLTNFIQYKVYIQMYTNLCIGDVLAGDCGRIVYKKIKYG